MKAQNNVLFWVDQVNEFNGSQGFSLYYTNSKIKEINTHNETIILNNIYNLYNKDVNNCGINICIPQEFKMSSISYKDKQPTELNS